MIRAIIVEDEIPARIQLRRMLEKHADFIDIIHETDNGKDAIVLVNEYKPDLLFLDIHLLDMTGFDVLSNIKGECPYVIFTTAFDTYALKAFEVMSVEYLLKPIEQIKFDRAIDKLKNLIMKSISSSLTSDELAELTKSYNQQKKYSLSVTQGQSIVLVAYENISHFVADDKYVSVHCLDGKKYLTQKTMTFLEEYLPPNFLRIHRSTIVNIDHVKSVSKDFKSRYILSMGDTSSSRLQSSIQYKDAIKSRLGIH